MTVTGIVKAECMWCDHPVRADVTEAHIRDIDSAEIYCPICSFSDRVSNPVFKDVRTVNTDSSDEKA